MAYLLTNRQLVKRHLRGVCHCRCARSARSRRCSDLRFHEEPSPSLASPGCSVSRSTGSSSSRAEVASWSSSIWACVSTVQDAATLRNRFRCVGAGRLTVAMASFRFAVCVVVGVAPLEQMVTANTWLVVAVVERERDRPATLGEKEGYAVRELEFRSDPKLTVAASLQARRPDEARAKLCSMLRHGAVDIDLRPESTSNYLPFVSLKDHTIKITKVASRSMTD